MTSIHYLCRLFLLIFISLLIGGCGGSDNESTQSDHGSGAEQQSETSETTTEPVQEVQQEIETEVAAAEPQEETVVEATGQSASTPKEHIINAQARVFAPEIIYIQPGDSIQWVNMVSHNAVSIDDLIPKGATGWRSKLGENLSITLTVEGIYAYVCEPHIGFGMVGVIIVGDPGDIDAVNAKAREVLQGPYRRLIGKLRKVKPLK